MPQDDLRRFFGELLFEQGEISSESMAVLGKLIRLTIDYRDKLKSETGEILTVQETKKATIAYVAALRDGVIPEGLDEKIRNLVRLWLKEINKKFY